MPLLFYYRNASTWSLIFLQLRRTRVEGNRFSNDVLIRLVRLTIETNAITGTHPLITRPGVHLTPC
jgi:hypothetical protein